MIRKEHYLKVWGICIFNKIRFNAFYVITKKVQLLQILNDLSIKHLIKLVLHENVGM